MKDTLFKAGVVAVLIIIFLILQQNMSQRYSFHADSDRDFREILDIRTGHLFMLQSPNTAEGKENDFTWVDVDMTKGTYVFKKLEQKQLK